jgi:hypothetical protein
MSQTGSMRPLDPARTITIVSGMPRSGTSMMMQMLEAAGLEVATDESRVADEDNPKGYYELDAVKRMPDDAAFMKSLIGRVVKVVAPLLIHLPPEYDYRILFIERDLDEIMASQRSMLERLSGGEVSETHDEALAQAIEHQLGHVKRWLAQQEQIRTCFVRYRFVLDAAREASVVVADFLEETGGLPSRPEFETKAVVASRMAAVVDPGLYRHSRTGRR